VKLGDDLCFLTKGFYRCAAGNALVAVGAEFAIWFEKSANSLFHILKKY